MKSGKLADPEKVLIVGPGGCGKSELAALIGRVGVKAAFIDVEDSTKKIDCNRMNTGGDPWTYDMVRQALQDEETLKDYQAVAIDSLTKLEELAQQWVVMNVPHEKGQMVKNIEGYGFGKGFTHTHDAMLAILGDLDQQIRRGRHVILTAHQCTNKPENADGDNFAVVEPRLLTTKDGKNSFRHRVVEWVDHVFLIKYDILVEDGKATGSGSRAIYTQAQPQFIAKSRSLKGQIIYTQGNPDLWVQLLGKAAV